MHLALGLAGRGSLESALLGDDRPGRRGVERVGSMKFTPRRGEESMGRRF